MKFFKNIKALFLFLCVGIILTISAPVLAQDNVQVRAGAHEDYSRLVFEWPDGVAYDFTESSGQITLTFKKQGMVDLTKINAEIQENIGTVNVTSSEGEPLSLSIQVKPESKVRHFQVGKRIIIDVYNAPGKIEKVAVTQNKNENIVDDPAVDDLESVDDIDIPQPLLEGIEPHVITLTSTQNVGMAAFEREGFLWMVFDDSTLKTTPVLAGPNKDDFSAIEKIDVEGASVFRMPIPTNYYRYGEGGGLLWRVVLTPNPRASKPIKPIIKPQKDSLISAGTLIFPLGASQKQISFIDPLVGDKIHVVTTDVSTDFTGPKRQYVELEVLKSIVGLAYVPKADDIESKIQKDGVYISKPQGLALSPEQDIAIAQLKDDIQKEQEFFEKEENTAQVKRIFDFDRWVMGGERALENNRQILMRSLSAKEGSAKVEDLITLAKLSVANDRGHEALGLLRVAAQELPGIDENTEFIALRGAAATLAGKYDEAIEDLTNPAVTEFGESLYWRTFALAGLEDWRQADKTMPKDFKLVEGYPVHIRKPMILRLSEVALRAGDTATAEDLLMVLEPEFPSMSLPERSAWKYLNGELERQNGNEEEAVANWQTLITGKDDYYRAKAGLSLTRLQLDNQKITPAKAIDRLESLRYAWRGDELETLINFRLGEVYIDNSDYLKGFSVLRNAVALSPNSPMAQEVTDYMTDHFRKLFTEGKLKEMSAVDAVSLYDEFKELTPIGKEGDVFVQNLAERLVDIDLLGRASDLLSHQLQHRLTGVEAYRIGNRLASIQLLNDKADDAFQTLQMVEKYAPLVSDEDMKRQSKLLQARALSKTGRATQALSSLKTMPNDPDVNRLRADIAWNAGQWGEAARAFNNLIQEANISTTRPPEDYESNLILNRAIALNLSGDRSALDNLRNQYGDLMKQTEKAKIFDLVTRPRQLGMLNDKESVSSLISEVDLFGEFLENYRASE